MNRSFFADDDPEAKIRLTEVEYIRNFMEENFSKKFPEKRSKSKSCFGMLTVNNSIKEQVHQNNVNF